jgi:hypothetical protein
VLECCFGIVWLNLRFAFIRFVMIGEPVQLPNLPILVFLNLGMRFFLRGKAVTVQVYAN